MGVASRTDFLPKSARSTPCCTRKTDVARHFRFQPPHNSLFFKNRQQRNHLRAGGGVNHPTAASADSPAATNSPPTPPGPHANLQNPQNTTVNDHSSNITNSSSGSSSSRASSAAPLSLELQYRQATPADFWATADVHCCAFYPNASRTFEGVLRLERVLNLQEGSKTTSAKFACLVASGQLVGEAQPDNSAPAASSSSSINGDLQGSRSGSSGEITGFITMSPVVSLLARMMVAESTKVNFGARHQAQGIQGAVVVDTLNLFIPTKRVVTLNGNIREERRRHIAYLSNLAVSPHAQRRGVGRQLLLQAEAKAREWGCRSMALHVDRDNAAAWELYQGEGYRAVSTQTQWERMMEGRRTPLVLMLKYLGKGQKLR